MAWTKSKRKKLFLILAIVALFQFFFYSIQLITGWALLTNFKKFYLPLQILIWLPFSIISWRQYKKVIPEKSVE